MASQEFPVTLHSSKAHALLSATFAGAVVLPQLPAIYIGLVKWPLWPAPIALFGGLSGLLLFGFLVYYYGYRLFQPDVLVIGKDGVSLTRLGEARDIPWSDIARIGQLSASPRIPRNVVLFLKTNSPSWNKNKKRFRLQDRIVLGNRWRWKRRYDGDEIAALLDQGRRQFTG